MLRVCLALPLLCFANPSFAQDGADLGVVSCPADWCDDGNPCTQDDCTLLMGGGHTCSSDFADALEGEGCVGSEWAVYCSGDGVCGADFGLGEPNSCPAIWCDDGDEDTTDTCALTSPGGGHTCAYEAGPGYDEGYDEGFDDGELYGFDEGYEEGLADAVCDVTSDNSTISAAVCTSVSGTWDGSVCTPAVCDFTMAHVTSAYDDGFTAGADSAPTPESNDAVVSEAVCASVSGIWDGSTCTAAAAEESMNCFQSGYCQAADDYWGTGAPNSIVGNATEAECLSSPNADDSDAWGGGWHAASALELGWFFYADVCE